MKLHAKFPKCGTYSVLVHPLLPEPLSQFSRVIWNVKRALLRDQEVTHCLKKDANCKGKKQSGEAKRCSKAKKQCEWRREGLCLVESSFLWSGSREHWYFARKFNKVADTYSVTKLSEFQYSTNIGYFFSLSHWFVALDLIPFH